MFLIKRDIPMLDTKNLKELQRFVHEEKIEIMIINMWKLLRKEILTMTKYGCINIHPSKLPKYRGALPTLWALKNQDSEAAVTYMKLDDTVDGGDILAQIVFKITPLDDAITLEKKVKDIVQATLIELIRSYVEEKIEGMPQRHELASKTARYQDYKKIDFHNEKAMDIYNKVVLYHYHDPAANCYAIFSGTKVPVLGCRGVSNEKVLEPGVYKIMWGYLYIGCQDGCIKVSIIRDLNPISAFKFLKGALKYSKVS
ncbi:methionyl-tRNA formyltransferase [Negadavirga shengliensis]|uniref:Methionyl-tRNA formyltransferase n=1 Tax=Negadavirga shengliensis TaxID=1389218 RepID=A0ABV9T321_9BACT